MSKRRISIEEINDRIYKVHGNTVKMVDSTYAGTHKKAIFVDKDLGEWSALPVNVYSLGNGHPDKRGQKISDSKKIPVEIIAKRIEEKHGGLVRLDTSTYIGTAHKARFIDKDYGEWYTVVMNVLHEGCSHPDRSKENKKETCLKKFGVDSPTKNIDIALKAAKKSNNKHVRYHWKTDQELICQASWEPLVVDYLNDNKIDFEWQPKTFTMPNGKTYRPDLYLVNQNIWVEIKGYMRPHSQLKWDWFKSENPTAELWDKKKLKEMGIL